MVAQIAEQKDADSMVFNLNHAKDPMERVTISQSRMWQKKITTKIPVTLRCVP